MIENIMITTVPYYLRNSTAKILSGFTKTYPRNTTTKGLLYIFSLCENIKTLNELTWEICDQTKFY